MVRVKVECGTNEICLCCSPSNEHIGTVLQVQCRSLIADRVKQQSLKRKCVSTLRLGCELEIAVVFVKCGDGKQG